MSLLLGPFDPIKLIFNIINSLMAKGLITQVDARNILKEALDPNMSEVEKEKFIDSLFINKNA